MLTVVAIDWVFANSFGENTKWVFWVINLGQYKVITYHYLCFFFFLIFKPLDSKFDFQHWEQIFNDSRESAAIIKLST